MLAALDLRNAPGRLCQGASEPGLEHFYTLIISDIKILVIHF